MINTDWLSHRVAWWMHNFGGKNPEWGKYYDKEIHDIAATNQKIRELILSKKPFMAGRFGRTELKTMIAYQKECRNLLIKMKVNNKIVRNAGFFPKNTKEVKKFVKLMEDSCKSVDLLGVWNLDMEDYMVNKYCKSDCWLGRLRGLEPWYSEQEPWSELLRDKRVVFVHAFEASMRKQWGVRNKLFTIPNILPEFELRIVKAVQTIAGNKDKRFSSWFDALAYMYSEVMKEDFDIAIIGCGAYGFPLAAKIKEAGKQVIHLGGATQLFLGIKGKRWDHHPVISKMYNEYWIRPLAEDVIENSNQVEDGCYW